MKLKRILAGVLTGAMVITGIPALGLDRMSSVLVYADENDLESTGTEGYSNVALNKDVKTSSVNDAGDGSVSAAAAVDGKLDTKWESTNLRQVSPQWFQIDLGQERTSVERIEVVFDGTMWDQGYTIQTYDSEKNAQRNTVRTIPANGIPAAADGAVDTGNRNTETKTDTILRNEKNEKIILNRYVNFSFSLQGTGTDEKKVSIAEIRIYGVESRSIYGPAITMTAPAAGEYPAIAEIYASDDENAVYHETLEDRATPAASFMRQDGTDTNWTDQTRQIGTGNPTTVTAPLWAYTDDMAVGKLQDDEVFVKDGVLGFNAQVHTPGTVNKFDVWKDDIVVASFQLYLDKFPTTGNKTRHLFAKGNKYNCSLDGGSKKIVASVLTDNQNAGWIQEKYQLTDDDLQKWIDVLMVIDGHGYLRLYVDGKPASEIPDKANGQALLHSGKPANGFRPFSLCYSEAGDRTGSGESKTPLKTENSFLQKDEGYLARFKFYTNKDNNGVLNGAGTDISESQKLSEDFVNTLNIQTLESANGAANVGKIITNMLQKEEPTARITLCPYSRSTVWSKKGSAADAEWTEMAATEKFADDIADMKYKATTTLKADDGFIFDESCIENVMNTIDEGADDAMSTVKISDKERVLTIVTYYGCQASDVEDTCHIDELMLRDDPIQLTVGETKAIGAQAKGVGKCANHIDAVVKYTYKLPDGEKRVTVDEEKGTLTAVGSTKGMIGYDSVKLTITAALVKDDAVVQSGGKDVKLERTVNVQVDEKDVDQVIEYAPSITAQAPVKGKYPEVVDIAISKDAKHFTDIADRMNPSATLEPLTVDYINDEANEQYIKTGTSSQNNKRPANPNDEWLNSFGTEDKYDPVIENVDGIWAFNAIGQTPGDTNKFDVFGEDIKLVSFKLYLKKWPENPYKTDGKYNEKEEGTDADNDGTTIDIYGKGNKYAFQVASSKKLIMYMQADKTREDVTLEWPQQTFEPEDPDAFLNKWHNIFMVVDGKGWQRLYVDGKRSRSRGAVKKVNDKWVLDEAKDKERQGGAYAKETTASNKKPFTLGYNSLATHPSWYDGIFDNTYGYISDFEFYSDKNYDNVINGAGTDISTAQKLPEKFAEKIDLEQLEEDHADNLDDIGTILTNMLQETNATAMLTVSPYVTKTNWYQETTETGEGIVDGFKMLDKIDAEKFDYATRYRVQVEMTAFEGFKFADTEKFKQDVEQNFTTAGGDQAESVVVTVDDNASGEDKVLRIVATYGKLPAPCICGVESITPQNPISIVIPEDKDTEQAALPQLTDADAVVTDCQADEHTYGDAKTRIHYEYSVPEASRDIIELDEGKTKITAKKSGDAVIDIEAEYQYQDGTEWKPIKGTDGTEKKATTSITVHVTKAGEASSDEKEALGQAADKAANDYPVGVKDDYQEKAWNDLQAAIQAAKDLSTDSHATAAAVADAAARLNDAITALKNNKSPKGIAKDALQSLLDDEGLKALIAADNADKTYTAESFEILKTAYADAAEKITTADADTLRNLKTVLDNAWKGLEKVTTGGSEPGTGVKDGDSLTGADGTKYQVASAKDKTVIITKGIDTKKITVGPTVVINKETYKVIGIGNAAFKGLKRATKVVINANVAAIGDQAFANSKKLKNVTIGADVAKIGKKAFFKCPKLNKVILKGKGLTNKSIGKQAFKKTAKKAAVKWGKVKGKQRTQLKKALKKAGLKVK